MNAVTRFTPGPWQVVNGSDVFTLLGGARADGLCANDNDAWQIADCGVGVCFIDGEEHDLPYSEENANARLMAAAPELLEALLDARKQLEGYEEALNGEDYNSPRINAAIAKATGASA